MGRLSSADGLRHIWLAKGCLPYVNVLETGKGEAASAESRFRRAAGAEGDNMT